MTGYGATKRSQLVRIPKERIAVLIGSGGAVKRQIEERGGVELTIDSKTGDVIIQTEEANLEGLFKVANVVTAIGRGFSPERAFRLFEDDAILDVIDLRDYVGRSESALKRIKGRIIGERGRARKVIEEVTDSFISVYGHTVSVISDSYGSQIARQAIEMLIRGRQHGTVYRFLFRRRREMKLAELEAKRTLWK